MNQPGNAEFAGRRVLVTGGTRGMGRAVADLLAGAGAGVLTTARSMPADGAPGGLFVPADVSTPEGTATIAGYTLDRLGGVDVVVHAAGASLSRSGGVLALDDDAWQRNLDINLLAAVRLDRALLPALLAQRSGVIIHVSSAQWRRPDGTAPAYAAAKAALTNYSKGLAREMAPHGIRVLTVTRVSSRPVRRRLGSSGWPPRTARTRPRPGDSWWTGSAAYPWDGRDAQPKSLN